MSNPAVEQSQARETLRSVAWYRDPGLWIALLATLSIRLLSLLLWITAWRHQLWVGHLKYDLSTWRRFFDHARDGGIPYVDFPREYPVFAGCVYWVMAFFVRPKSEQSAILVHSTVMLIADVVNAGLFYVLARQVNARFALVGTLLFSFNLTALVLGPMRFESIVVTTLLIGYMLQKQGRSASAAALWSLGSALKWYPAFLFAAQELKTFVIAKRRWAWWRPVLAFVLVQLLVNGPFLVGGWLKNGNIDAWTQTYNYHLDRQLSVDTLLGVAQLWWGPLRWERYAAHLTLLLIAAAVVVRPSLELARKAVLIGIAIVIFNRIYSPQFNLWFYPFLVLWMLSLPRKRAVWALGLFVMLDVTNVLAYPFAFTDALLEMGTFDGTAAAEHGHAETIFWSASIALRAVVLIAIGVETLREPSLAPSRITRRTPAPVPRSSSPITRAPE